jgi:aminoglycoside/choline kinase family phosphotransferase
MDPNTIARASADASFRRYFRLRRDDESYIVMDAPPAKEDIQPFIEIAERFHAIGLNVPLILERDLDQGFLLLSDLGDQLYLDRLNRNTVEQLYGDAMDALVVLQAGGLGDEQALPPYDRALLWREMELFREWYLGRHLGLSLAPSQNGALDRVFETLAQSALEQPRVWVHRDFHSRNLLVTRQNNPGILDFQDAVTGPVTYDLVSLLRDCYITWPREQVEGWVNGYYYLGERSGLPVGGDADQFLHWFDRMGVQRHLKAIGIFARLNHRDGKPDYLLDIPRVTRYVVDVTARDPALQPLNQLLQDLGLAA